MTYAIIMLLCFGVFIAFLKPRNKYTWLLCVMILGMAAILFSLLKIAAKIGNYYIPPGRIFVYDYQLYASLVLFPIGLQDINTIGTIGIILFAYTAALLGAVYYASAKRLQNYWVLRISAVLAVFPILYCIVFSPSFRYYIYIQYFRHFKRFLFPVFVLGNHVIQFILVLYLLFPLVLLWSVFRTVQSHFKRQQTLSLGICLCVLEGVFALIYFGGPTIRFFSDDISLQSMLLLVGWNHSNPALFYRVLPFIVLVVIFPMLLTLLRFGGLTSLRRTIPRRLSHANQQYSSNLRGVFHSFKNTFFAYTAMLDELREYADKPEILALTERMEHFNEKNIENVNNALNTLWAPYREKQITEVHRALAKAAERCRFNDSIQIRMPQANQPCYILFSSYQIIEVFTNLLQNAVEAIVASNRKDGLVTVDILHEDQAVIIRISDNGPGISKKDRRHIFEPFYSTKAIGRNWGLGLSYAATAVSAHGGLIGVYNVKNGGTLFELMLCSPGKDITERIERNGRVHKRINCR